MRRRRGEPVKLETDVGPMQGSTAGIIWDFVFLHVPEIGINLQRKKKLAE